MYPEEHYWRKRLSRAVTRATSKPNSLLKAFWRVLTFQTYRDCRKLVEQAVVAYGHSMGSFNDELDSRMRVACIVKRISDSENAACWGVDCAHVARHMDKSFEDYTREASQSYKILWRLVYSLKEPDNLATYEALNEAYEHIESYEKAHDNRKEVARPGDAPRAFSPGFGEEGTLP